MRVSDRCLGSYRVHKRMEGARPRGPATQGRVCLTCRLQQAQRFGDRLLSSRPAAQVWKTTRIFTRKRRSCVRKCLRRMGATRCPGRHHTHMCMTGTGDTACCQIAATLQAQFGADCADVWQGGDEETGGRVYGTGRVRRRTPKGLIASG